MSVFQYGSVETDYLKSKDKVLGAYINQVGHIERETWGDLFSALIRSIVGQQISAKAHQTIESRITDKLGNLTPAKVDSLSVEQWQQFGMTFRKAEYIKGVAQQVLSGELDIDSLADLPDDEVIKRLVKINGIGQWTAEMLMIFSLNRSDIISYGDLAILRGMCRLYHHRQITKSLFAKYQRRYSPYASVASLYLWHIGAN